MGNNKVLQAIISILSGMAVFGLIDNFVQLAAQTGGLWQFHFLRSIEALIILAAIAWFTKTSLWPKRWGAVIVRSLLTTIAMVIYFGCLGFMPIAQVAAGLFTSPIFVVLFSVLFFGETVGPRRIIAVIIGFAGAILALRPDADGISVWTLLPVMAGAVYAMGGIATRRWCEDEGTLTLLGAFFLNMLIWGAIGVAFLALWPLPVLPGGDGFFTRGWVTPSGAYLVVIMVQGAGSLLGVGLAIRAYQLAEPTVVAVFENGLLVFATVWAFFLWGQIPDALGLVGIGLIVLAGVIIAIRSDPPVPAETVTVVK